MLPELRIYTTPEDIKYILFEQPEVISDEIRNRGVWNEPCLDLCNKVLSKSSGGRVIDIGAGFGTFSVPLALKHGERFIFSAFEPLNTINQQLNANILLNNIDNIRAYPFGLGDKNTLVDAPVLDVRHSSNHGSYSFDVKTNVARNMPNSGNNEVYEFRTLDSFRFAGVKLVKISAPGMELAVLQGAAETLAQSDWPPVIFESWSMEWYKEERAKVLDFFASRGYEHYVMIGEHIMAFKTKAQHDFAINESPAAEIGSFTISEQSHDISSVLQNQAALK
jgi:FkbM family methyltransferase